MKIALVTNKDFHHKYWAYELYNKHNVKLIIHPIGQDKRNLLKKIKNKVFKYGIWWSFLKALSIIYNIFSSDSIIRSLNKKEKEYFKEYKSKYLSIPDSIINNVKTINCKESLELVKNNDIDIICFLGGEIAKKDFINSAKIACINYHSGISPFYNGTKTIYHTVSDQRPNFAGGTLMKMSKKIDGGEILMHFLPNIKENDTAADLFCKTIIGSIKLYNNFLENNKWDQEISGIKQKKSFKYVRNIDWTIVNDLRNLKFERSKRMKIYQREEKIIDYSNKGYKLENLYSIILKIILG